jgi:putative Mg2+ transporter-C (MgtC) family protein
MDLTIYLEGAAQVSFAFIVGAIIGLEREFRAKPAGFRTMIFICVGSCLYTILSIESNTISPDRIASNIVTGVGFIGAGVIFKEGISVNGLTTSALIWIIAALGMAIGFKNYPLAIVVTSMVVIALLVLEPVQRFINRFHRVKEYKIKTADTTDGLKNEMEAFFKSHDISYRCIKMNKENKEAIYLYRIAAPNDDYDIVNEYLLQHNSITSFDV